MEVDLQSLFGLHVTWCTQLYSLAETPQLPPSPRIWTRIGQQRLTTSLCNPLELPFCSYFKKMCLFKLYSVYCDCCVSVTRVGSFLYFSIWPLDRNFATVDFFPGHKFNIFRKLPPLAFIIWPLLCFLYTFPLAPAFYTFLSGILFMLRLKLVHKKRYYLYYTYFPLWSPIVKLLSPSLSTALRLESGALPECKWIHHRWCSYNNSVICLF
jgi:hypothetical protein